ncbi:hypothetical protein ABPG75_013080 [Micractinium tetrahymenae]
MGLAQLLAVLLLGLVSHTEPRAGCLVVAGRTVNEQSPASAATPPAAPAASPAAGSAGNASAGANGVQWAALRASHGGSVKAASSSINSTTPLYYISVPHAILLGTTIAISSQPTEEACAAACAATRFCALYNYCPPGAAADPAAIGGGCLMDPALTIGPPTACYLLQHTAIQSPSLIPLLANGSGIVTSAGAPLSPDLVAGVPASLPGFTGLLGFTLIAVGNFPCPGSYQLPGCVLPGSPDQLAATCSAEPVCGSFVYLPRATPWLPALGAGNSSRLGALKALSSNISLSQLSYTPYAAVYLRDDKVPLVGGLPGPPAGPPGSARLGVQAAAPPPAPVAAGADMSAQRSWSILVLSQAELRAVGSGSAIVAPHVYLPGAQLAGLSIEQSVEACLLKCLIYPDCHAVTYCPASEPAPCVVSAFGISPIPPGGCSMLYEQAVAGSTCIPVLASGPGMHTVAGIPVNTPANLSVPGYRQHLAQALFGAYDLPAELCPGSLRQELCRFVGTPQDIARRCSDNPVCFGFTWRESPAPESGANSSSGVLKGFLPGTAQQIDPGRINWNPGLSLFIQEDVPLPAGAALPQPSAGSPAHPAEAAASEPAAEAGTAAAGDLGPGSIAGIAVGLAAAGMLSAAGGALWRRRRRAAAGLRLPPALARAASGIDSATLEVAVLGLPAATLTTPRQRVSPPHRGLSPVVLPAVGAGNSSHDKAARQHLAAVSDASIASAGPKASSSSSTLLISSQRAPAAAAGRGGEEAAAAAAAAAAEEAEAGARPGMLSGAARLLAELSPEWGEALVSEGDVRFLLGPDGRPIILGAGGFGQVYKVLLAGHTQCAAKIVPWQGREHAQRFFLQEAAMLKRLRHPNVVGFQGICVTEQRGILLMDFCAGRDLDAVMHAQSRASGQRLFGWYGRGRKVAEDVASGLAYLHHSRILHLDLKPHNVLLARDGTARIGDVGFARLLTRTHLSTARFGTCDWASPELLLGQGATDKSDVWSFGVILWELCSGMQPRRGQLAPLRVPEDCPAEVAALQAACIHPNPDRRPSAAELVALLMGLPASRRPPPPPAMPPRLSHEAQRPEQGQAGSLATEAEAQAGEPPAQEGREGGISAAAGEQAGSGLQGPAPVAAGMTAAAQQGAAGFAAAATQSAGASSAGEAGPRPGAAGLAGTPSLPSWLGDALPPSPASTLGSVPLCESYPWRQHSV